MKSKLFLGFLAIALAVGLTAPAGAQLIPYDQDFESLDQTNGDALAADGWLVFANVFEAGTGNYLYGYGPFVAPNPGGGFSAIASGEGGPDQGVQQLSVYSDYNNGDHNWGHWIEANVFQEQIVGAGDVGSTWIFNFDAKSGNINDPNDPNCTSPCSTTAMAFIKTLDPNAGWALTNFLVLDTTSLPNTWGSFELSLEIDASLAGQIFQIGFANTATLWQPSGVLYDNINFAKEVCNEDPTVAIDGCDSGVANRDLDTGCTMNDAIFECAQNSIHHGKFVSCVASLTNGWVSEELIKGEEKGRIIRCAAHDRTNVLHNVRETPGHRRDSRGRK